MNAGRFLHFFLLDININLIWLIHFLIRVFCWTFSELFSWSFVFSAAFLHYFLEILWKKVRLFLCSRLNLQAHWGFPPRTSRLHRNGLLDHSSPEPFLTRSGSAGNFGVPEQSKPPPTFIDLPHDGDLQVFPAVLLAVETHQDAARLRRQPERRHHVHVTELTQTVWQLLHCYGALLCILETQHVNHWGEQETVLTPPAGQPLNCISLCETWKPRSRSRLYIRSSFIKTQNVFSLKAKNLRH